MASEERAHLLRQLAVYTSDYPEELSFRDRFIQLINQHENCFERSLLKGHITGSAWIMDESHGYAFMTHHAKLDKWLQLGGHADGDENVARVALKEAEEESGIEGLELHSLEIFDLDIHTIPERKGVPEHEHFDIRYLIVTDRFKPFKVSEESNELAWLALEDMSAATDGNRSIMRMVEKSKIIGAKMSPGAY